MIATVGARQAAGPRAGADHVILYRDQDVAAEVRRITAGGGVPVAYDSVGKDTFEGTLAAWRGGPVRQLRQRLGAAGRRWSRSGCPGGSLFFTRPTLGD